MTDDGQPVVYKSRRLVITSTLGVLLSFCFTWMALTPPGPLAAQHPIFWALASVLFVASVFQQITLGFTSIQISTKGMVFRYWRFSRGSFEWSDIVEFFPERLLGRNYVAFTLSPAFREKLRRKRYSGIQKGMLPDTYGFTAPALAKLLNAQRKSALAELAGQNTSS